MRRVQFLRVSFGRLILIFLRYDLQCWIRVLDDVCHRQRSCHLLLNLLGFLFLLFLFYESLNQTFEILDLSLHGSRQSILFLKFNLKLLDFRTVATVDEWECMIVLLLHQDDGSQIMRMMVFEYPPDLILQISKIERCESLSDLAMILVVMGQLVELVH